MLRILPHTLRILSFALSLKIVIHYFLRHKTEFLSSLIDNFLCEKLLPFYRLFLKAHLSLLETQNS